MNGEKLREALDADPFVPFKLFFGSGRSVEVTNPGLVATSSNGRFAYVFEGQGEGGRVVDLMLVESIDFSKRNGNGSHKRGRRGRSS